MKKVVIAALITSATRHCARTSQVLAVRLELWSPVTVTSVSNIRTSEIVLDTSAETYVVAIPWYERGEFDELWELAEDRAELPRSYAAWHQRASAVYSRLLSAGMPIQLVTVRRSPLLKWLSQNGLRNTSSARKRYVEERAGARAEIAQAGLENVASNLSLSDQ